MLKIFYFFNLSSIQHRINCNARLTISTFLVPLDYADYQKNTLKLPLAFLPYSQKIFLQYNNFIFIFI